MNNILNTQTKILATIGPATSGISEIKKLILAGADGIRFNMSHGNYDFFTDVFNNIHQACIDEESPLAILVDLQGPKIRIGELEKDEIEIQTGKTIEITNEEVKGNEKVLSTNYAELIDDAEVGKNILINDGLIRLKITEKKIDRLICLIEEGGILTPRKGLNLPGIKLSTPSVTEKDFSDLEFILKHRVDYIALSFVRSASDILKLRDWLKERNHLKPVIAKIEKKEAVDDLESIIEAADGIMIARGDLGVELSPQDVPVIQKDIIKRCNELGKLVITATQMLESMIHSQIPTRAEASDVANAVWDGTDVVMLSGETSVGKFPIDTVKVMNEIICKAEEHHISTKNINFEIPKDFEENIFDSGCRGISIIADQVKAKAIVVFTFKGRAASGIAKYRPASQIIAISNEFDTMNYLCLRWGVKSLFMEKIEKDHVAIDEAKKLILEAGLVKKDDIVIFMSRAPHTDKSRTDWLRFEVM
jgi:pyruvate kinase